MNKIYGYCRVSTVTQSIKRQIDNIKPLYPDAIFFTEKYTGTKMERAELDKLRKVVESGDTIVFDSVSRMARTAAEGYELYEEWYQKGVNLIFLVESDCNTEYLKSKIETQRINFEVSTGKKFLDNFFNKMIEAMNDLVLDMTKDKIYAAFEQAEKEVKDLQERVKQGMKASGATGEYATDENGEVIYKVTEKTKRPVIAKQGKISIAKTGKKIKIKKEAPAKEIIRTNYKAFGGTLNGKATAAAAGISWNTFKKYVSEIETTFETK